MLVDLCFVIAAKDAERACPGETEIVARLHAAMRETKRDYPLTGEVVRIQAACAGAMAASLEPSDRDRIAASCRMLVAANNIIALAMAGDQAALDRLPWDDEPARDDLLPLMRLWAEAGDG